MQKTENGVCETIAGLDLESLAVEDVAGPELRDYVNHNRRTMEVSGLVLERDLERTVTAGSLARWEQGLAVTGRYISCYMRFAGRPWSPKDAAQIAMVLGQLEEWNEKARLFELVRVCVRTEILRPEPKPAPGKPQLAEIRDREGNVLRTVSIPSRKGNHG
jgi:hypothetical protein